MRIKKPLVVEGGGYVSPASSQEAAETAIRLSKEEGIIWDNLAQAAFETTRTGTAPSIFPSSCDGKRDGETASAPKATRRRKLPAKK